jgi:AraC family transcriptional regulator of adaptative response / DNA-3-methyladenine glycosylase II
MLAFFAGRATPGVESVDGDTYRRTWRMGERDRIIEIGPDTGGGALRLRIVGSRTRPGTALAGLARRVFDTEAPIAEIGAGLKRDETLRHMLRRHPGVRVPGAWDGFELTIRAILGQQISVKAATTIAGRIAARYGEPVSVPPTATTTGLDRLFPTPRRLERARFNNIGLVQTRIDTIRSVSSAVRSGALRFDGSMSADEVRRTLKSIRGIGDWTAEYVAMRALGDPDAFPVTDLGLLSAIARPDRVTPKVLGARAEAWRPWRAYAAMLLWGSLAGSGG